MTTFGFVVMSVLCWFLSSFCNAGAGSEVQVAERFTKPFAVFAVLGAVFHLAGVTAVVVIVTVNR